MMDAGLLRDSDFESDAARPLELMEIDYNGDERDDGIIQPWGGAPALALDNVLPTVPGTCRANTEAPESSVEDPEHCRDIKSALDVVAVELATLRTENAALRDAAAALEAQNEHAAYLSSLLAITSIQGFVSTPLPGTSLEADVAHIFEMIYAGGQPQNEMYDDMVRLPPAVYMRIENSLRTRALQFIVRWRSAPRDQQERADARKLAINIINARERGRNYLAVAHPHATLHIWRESAPSDPAHVAARQLKQTKAMNSIELDAHQLECIRVAWLEYCAGVTALDREADVAAAVAVATADGLQYGRSSFSGLSRAAQSAAANVVTVQSIIARRVVLYSRLANRVTSALTWVQALFLPITMTPYSPVYTEICPALLMPRNPAG